MNAERRGIRKTGKFERNNSPELIGLEKKERYIDALSVFLLLGFGIYHSILYWGHQPVPHFDFHCFASLGREILNFQVPSSFKRVPLVGVLQVLLGKIVGGTSPDFTGGWLLNALLHPFNGVLIFLIARKFIGKAAFWLALICIINSCVLQLLTESIVETALLCGFLVTFYFIFKQSRWCYLFASITTMIRYEAAGLILIAFLLDMIRAENNKARVRAFIYSAIASIPLALWLMGTFLNWESQGSTYYLKELGQQSDGKIIFGQYIELLWFVAFDPLFMLERTSSPEAFMFLAGLSKLLAAAGFIFGTVYGLCKKNWNILGMVIFLALYLFIHAVHSWYMERFCMPVAWIPLLICFYGFQSGWGLLNRDNRMPKILVMILQAAVLIISLCWLAVLVPYLSKLAPRSTTSVSLPYVAGGLVLVFCIVRSIITKNLLREVAIAAFVILMIVSNQFTVARVVANGERDIEFKYLLDWYLENAQPDEKMAMASPAILQTMAPKYADNFINTGIIEAKNPNEFVSECFKRNITYVAWDSRMGLTPDSRYYKSWKMENIAPLIVPQDNGPYKFIAQFRASDRRYINLFRLENPNKKTQ